MDDFTSNDTACVFTYNAFFSNMTNITLSNDYLFSFDAIHQLQGSGISHDFTNDSALLDVKFEFIIIGYLTPTNMANVTQTCVFRHWCQRSNIIQSKPAQLIQEYDIEDFTQVNVYEFINWHQLNQSCPAFTISTLVKDLISDSTNNDIINLSSDQKYLQLNNMGVSTVSKYNISLNSTNQHLANVTFFYINVTDRCKNNNIIKSQLSNKTYTIADDETTYIYSPWSHSVVNCGTLTYSIQYIGKSSFSNFVTIDSATGQIKYKSNSNSDAGYYEFKVIAKGIGKNYQTSAEEIWTLDVIPIATSQVVNIGPPHFTSFTNFVRIKVNETFSYRIPSSYDPDNDEIAMFVYIGRALGFA
ncbi:UNKNOWN [Stylonychia lemnae]|uniref:Uncharacterized protein n=1 Tax=Stylonychia lemnae TaxID=5949 RepID=A0A078BAX8_STYLE|nr:UNKNOWN [Stylonychia lemnae]|eukprot:CDW91725.1 UNKNOWN [Stylonychia lemnae]